MARQRLFGTAAIALALACAGAAEAAASKPVPLPRPRPAAAAHAVKPQAARPAPKPGIALPLAQSASTAPADLAALKNAIDLVRKGKAEQALAGLNAMDDPVARKLVEWVALRSDSQDFGFKRYAAFIAANPTWPSLAMFRRKSEAAMWQDGTDAGVVRSFFAANKPLTAKGKLALARALLTVGDRTGAQQFARDAWRNDAMTSDLERQALDAFGTLLNGGDHKARMDVRLYAEDDDAGLRAAQRLGGNALAVAKGRSAVINKSANAGKLLDAVPEDAQRDAGYMFSRVQWLRRADKIAEAAQWMLAAPREAAAIHDTDEWWVERRLIARKLLDLGDARTAYRVASEAAAPNKENLRTEQQFTAGWIALRFLNDPAAAQQHFAAIAQSTIHPTGLARSYYWQGRAAEAAGRQDDARAQYKRAAESPAAYYGQLARARLGAGDILLHPAPELRPEMRATLERLELARAVELLYAIGEGDLVVPIAADLAERAEPNALAYIASITSRRGDARATLLLGRGALARGLPFDVHAYPVEGLPRYQAEGPTVEPHVAYAIARQESGFHPRAVSSANALGLMQVTPAAGKYVAKKLGIAFDQKRLLNDPAYNARIGAAELGDLIENYRGSYILSFAAYNAGRGRVREWLERFGDPRDPKIDPVDWVERIPFSETRNYVQRVMENLQVYRVRFGASTRLLIEADLRRGSAATN